MSPPTRRVPVPGQRVEIVRLGQSERAVIVRVEDRTVWVRAATGDAELPFDLHPTTAHFVARGEPYWGVRLYLLDVP